MTTQVIFAEDRPEQERVRELCFYYVSGGREVERAFHLLLDRGDQVTAEGNLREAWWLSIPSSLGQQVDGPRVCVAPGWAFYTDRTFLRAKPTAPTATLKES